MSFSRRIRLFLTILAVVAVLIAVKVTIHRVGAEYLTLDTLFSSVVAGTIFVIGLLLSGLMPDYKEAERMSGDMRVALESIHDDVVSFSRQTAGVRTEDLRDVLLGIVASIEKGLADRGDHAHLGAAVARTDSLVSFISELETLGMSQNFVVRIRGSLDTLRKCIYRIYYIQKIEFLPSVHVLIQTLACAVLILLMLLKTDGGVGSAMIFGFASFLFVFALHLVSVFEQPFQPGSHAPDKVSLFLLHEFVAKLRNADEVEEQTSSTAPMMLPRRDAKLAARSQ